MTTIAEAKKAIALSRLINTDTEYNKGYNDGLSLAVEKMEAVEKSVSNSVYELWKDNTYLGKIGIIGLIDDVVVSELSGLKLKKVNKILKEVLGEAKK